MLSVRGLRLTSKLVPGASAEELPTETDDLSFYLGRWWEHRSDESWEHAQNTEMNPHYQVPTKMPSPSGLPESNFVYFYHSDHLGSTSYVTDGGGEVYEHVQYFPHGELWADERSNTERLPYLFTGKELDQETGLYDFGARMYDPRIALWASPDPALADYLLVRNGKPGHRVSDLNLYAYASSNPLRYFDPDGRVSVEQARTYTPREGGGVIIDGPRREEALLMIRCAAVHSPSFREALFAQDARGADEAITIHGNYQTPGVALGASTLAQGAPGPDSGRAGGQILDIGDLMMLPSVDELGAGQFGDAALTQEEVVIHEVTEAIESRQLAGTSGVLGAASGRSVLLQAHAAAVQAENLARSEFGQLGARGQSDRFSFPTGYVLVINFSGAPSTALSYNRVPGGGGSGFVLRDVGTIDSEP